MQLYPKTFTISHKDTCSKVLSVISFTISNPYFLYCYFHFQSIWIVKYAAEVDVKASAGFKWALTLWCRFFAHIQLKNSLNNKLLCAALSTILFKTLRFSALKAFTKDRWTFQGSKLQVWLVQEKNCNIKKSKKQIRMKKNHLFIQSLKQCLKYRTQFLDIKRNKLIQSKEEADRCISAGRCYCWFIKILLTHS